MAETVEDLLSKLSIAESSKVSRNRSITGFQEALDRSGFTIFKPLSNLGYFGWIPSKNGKHHQYKSTLEEVTEQDIRDRLDVDRTPAKQAVPISSLRRQLPAIFANLDPQTHMNKFPYGNYHIASLHVAVQHRDFELKRADFYFGGSTLEALANCSSGTEDGEGVYLVLLVPSTSQTIMLLRHKEYEQTYSDPGFQFERLCTGQRMKDRHDEVIVEHLMEMKVGPYRVFFDAEADAVDDDTGNKIEIKASNPRYWGTKVMFQMISGGSLYLYAGQKARRSLVGIQCQTLEQVVQTALSSSYLSLSQLESNILRAMKTLKEEYMEILQGGQVYRMQFVGDKLTLKRYAESTSMFFPPQEVVENLLG